ncbi:MULTISPECIES: TerB family tellurite resistance protein [Marinobacter]|uniref:tellurite resistance TerB family protein n=1 Tax=Marinobacter TaxID=2742 RepID=UPI000DAD7A08|nr:MULTISPECIES: TerB family tellurite resistance protein [Marinobacter]
MIDVLKKLFSGDASGVPEPNDPKQLAIAATALMVQLARVDQSEDDVEMITIIDCALRSQAITREEATTILADARAHAEDATSLYEFTEKLNDTLDQAGKAEILENIWRVAFADGRIDKYEEQLIRRIAELLHLNHREYMECRHRAEQAMSS